MPNKTLTKSLWKVYHLLKYTNINDLKKIVEVGETLMVKVRENLGLSEPMNKISRPTYLSNNDDSLIDKEDGIEGGHGLSLDSHALLEQLQNISKAVKFWCGNNYILQTS